MKRAFTPIEALIVLAIVLILAAILFPVLMRHEGTPKRSVCQLNLKQIGLGLMQYAQDYNEKFPPVRVSSTTGWADTLQPYVKSTQIFQCPATQNSVQPLTDYSYNSRAARVTLTKFESVSQTILMGDGNDDAPTWSALSQLPASWIQAENSPAKRHLDGAIYGFADGHVKWKQPFKIKATFPVKGPDATFAIR